MKKVTLVFLCLLLSACVTNKLYTVSPEEYKQQVKTLGVLPILIDAESINYYSRDGLVSLLNLSTEAMQKRLVEKLRKQRSHFDVRAVEGDPQAILARLLAGHETIGEASATRFRYTFNPQGSSELADEAVADALLVVVVHGIKREETRWSSYSLRMEKLAGNFSSLLYTAAIVDPTGRVLWQLDMKPDEVLLRLDYPDFAEAHWNRTEMVRVKSISLTGLRRTLREPDAALLVDKSMPKPFGQMIDRIVDQMK